jgi:TRAP-type C4-dicarboxylate transport system permease small subunit
MSPPSVVRLPWPRCAASDGMNAARLLADRLLGLSATIGAIALFIEVITILVDVIGRAFGHPLFGSRDIITMSMVIVVFGGMALCDRVGGHIAVDLLERHYPDWLNRWVNIVSALLGAVIFIGIAYAVFDSARISRMLNLNTNLLHIPKSWFQWALVAFALLTAFGMALRAAEMILTGRDVIRDRERVG